MSPAAKPRAAPRPRASSSSRALVASPRGPKSGVAPPFPRADACSGMHSTSCRYIINRVSVPDCG